MPKVRANLSIDFEDHQLCKENKWNMSKLLRKAIREKREDQGIISSPNLKEEKRKRETFQKLSQKMRGFIENEGLLDKYLENENKL